jgi:hypothetical protein
MDALYPGAALLQQLSTQVREALGVGGRTSALHVLQAFRRASDQLAHLGGGLDPALAQLRDRAVGRHTLRQVAFDGRAGVCGRSSAADGHHERDDREHTSERTGACHGCRGPSGRWLRSGIGAGLPKLERGGAVAP